jgi:hypothetical protein
VNFIVRNVFILSTVKNSENKKEVGGRGKNTKAENINRIITHVISCFLLGNSPASEFYMPTFYTYPPMKMEQSVSKRRHIKFRRRGITQEKKHTT